ncbi:MAG: DUF4838 domain-containing protein [Verrucomicrobia bacterium]|nr:DUF4838 domain-containing protein [Verrucomicrobiota bacterium]
MKYLNKHQKILAGLAGIALVCSAQAGVELVKDGRAVSEIVIAQDAIQAVRVAAQDLQTHLKRMSGAELPIVEAPSPSVPSRVYVGESEFTRNLGFQPAQFNTSGLEILAEKDHVILVGPDKQRDPCPYGQTATDTICLRGSAILGSAAARPEGFPSAGLRKWQEFCGHKFTTQHLDSHLGQWNRSLRIHSNDDTGTWYAVAELLEQLGVRWYMPYEDGTVIPEKRTVTITEQHLVKQAKFDRREWCFYNAMRDDGEGIAWLKRLKAGNHNTILFNHTTYAIYSSLEQQQLHPEWLACGPDGKPYVGYPPGRGMPRYTDPGFRKAAVVYMNKVFDTFPDLLALAVGPPDGGVKMDARDLAAYGQPGDSKEHKASSYVWDFHVYLAQELKRSHPGKYLLYMSGYGARLVPTNVEEFPDNLIVPLRGYSPANRVLKTEAHALSDAWRQWHGLMRDPRRAPVWNYFLWYRTPTHPRYPVIFTQSLQDEMAELLPICDGKFIEIQPTKATTPEGREEVRINTPGLIHLMVYWQNKLFWNPNLDRKQMLEEYYTLFFGPAAAEMKEFIEFAEAVWMRQESRSVTRTTGFLKESDVDRFFATLARARAKAGKDTAYARRIARMEAEMLSLKGLFPNLARTGPLIRAYPVALSWQGIDGDVSKYQYGWTPLRHNKTGEAAPKDVETHAAICMTRDKSALIVAVDCPESRMSELKANCRANDEASIFQDDVVEVYINTPQRSYFKVVVNANSAIWDESTDAAIVERATLPILWNPGTKAAVKKADDRWTVEVMIPTKDFGEIGPSESYPWGIQVGRTRFAGGKAEGWAIAPTGGPYAALNRWGDLWIRPW